MEPRRCAASHADPAGFGRAGDGRAWLAMAKYQARLGAYDEAERTLRSGLKWEPESAYLLQAPQVESASPAGRRGLAPRSSGETQ